MYFPCVKHLHDCQSFKPSVAIGFDEVGTVYSGGCTQILIHLVQLYYVGSKEEVEDTEDNHRDDAASVAEPALLLGELHVLPEHVRRLQGPLKLQVLSPELQVLQLRVLLDLALQLEQLVECLSVFERAIASVRAHHFFQVVVLVLFHLDRDLVSLGKVSFLQRLSSLF